MTNKMSKNNDHHLTRYAFCKTVKSLVKQFCSEFYLELDWLNLRNRKIPVIGAIDCNDLNRLKAGLSASNFNVTAIETFYYQGLYFEASPADGGELAGLLVAPKREMINVNQDILNSTREVESIGALQAFGRDHQIERLAFIDYQSFFPLWRRIESLISHKLKISPAEMAFIKYENNHKEYLKHYLDFKNNHRTFAFNSEKYSHIEMFSWIYYWEVKIIAENLKHERISVHDVGTWDAHFPLLLSGLPSQDLFGLNIIEIIASDRINPKRAGAKFAEKVIKKNCGYKPVKLINLDLTKKLDQIPATDVIILNDVLEHLPNDELSLASLKKVWDKTGKLLIVHVPYEDAPNPAWGHFVTFDADKVRAWAKDLPGAHFLSDKYYTDHDHPLTGEGYLIVSR
ncbi:MAG TPA: hypothetical protein VHY08_15720 [Bacillota bacterium]|nr:hypothetical protein [Bacillota bacterium]